MEDNNAEYYYHFDGLGSVVALSDSDGDICSRPSKKDFQKGRSEARSGSRMIRS